MICIGITQNFVVRPARSLTVVTVLMNSALI
jgi:hypothetical protein